MSKIVQLPARRQPAHVEGNEVGPRDKPLVAVLRASKSVQVRLHLEDPARVVTSTALIRDVADRANQIMKSAMRAEHRGDDQAVAVALNSVRALIERVNREINIRSRTEK